MSSSWACDLRSIDMSPQTTSAVRVSKRFQGSGSLPALVASPKSRQAEEEVRQKFRNTLVSRYHSVVGAWRELDPRQHGRLSFFDFCRACHRLGYERETRQLWEAMDRNRDGFVSLDEFDEDVSRLLQGFAAAVEDRCGSAETAWQRFFAKTPGRCTADVFRRGCEQVGYTRNPDTVFNALNVQMSSKGISFKDFVLLDRWFRGTEEHKGKWDYQMLRPQTTIPARGRPRSAPLPEPLLRP
uniref:EF-hand domain-containing protein n=1 Tax=Alexandrium monilatum TaxID=311494 RepID=A0A7S4UXA3_9DINO